MRDDFAVFIITHGRPDKQFTYSALRNCGYTGKIYFVIDDTDTTIQQYIDNFGVDNIFIFDKNYYINSDRFDNGTNEGIYACATYARRAVEDIAKSLNLGYFVVADDDLVKFSIRFPINGVLKRIKIFEFDTIFDIYIEYLASTKIECLGFSNPMMFYDPDMKFVYGRLSNLPYAWYIRKGNSVADWPCWFGEDEIVGLKKNVTGNIWIVIPYVMRDTIPFGQGAMVDIYDNKQSLKKAFAEFRYLPSDFYIQVCLKGTRRGQYVLRTARRDLFPKIISSKYKKEIHDAD